MATSAMNPANGCFKIFEVGVFEEQRDGGEGEIPNEKGVVEVPCPEDAKGEEANAPSERGEEG